VTPVVIDDHLLLLVLLGEEPQELRPRGAVIATTGLWYHRLCRALSDQAIVGSMSRRLGDVATSVASRAVASVIDLPDTIELLSLRSLGWPMAEIMCTGARLNLLSLEALAAARHLRAEICLADIDANAPLIAAASRFEIGVRTIPA
jgi:hypothetical protein